MGKNRSYSLGLYEKSMPSVIDWNQRIHSAKKAGYDFVEISIDESDERLERLDNPILELEVKEALVKHQMPAVSLCLSAHRKYPLGSHDPEIRAQSLEIFRKAVDFAVRLGITIIQLAGYDVYYEDGDAETRRYFEENLRYCIDYASKKAILCGFETMETAFMDTVEKAMHYCDKMNSPYLQVYPDIGNLNNASLLYGHNLYKDIEKGRGHILAVHLKETIPGKYRDMDFGEGAVDFEKGIQTFWDQGIRLYSAEFWFDGKEDYETRLKEHASFLKAYLDRME